MVAFALRPISESTKRSRLVSLPTPHVVNAIEPSADRIFMSGHQRNFSQKPETGFVGRYYHLRQPTSSIVQIGNCEPHGSLRVFDYFIGCDARAISKLLVFENLQS